MASVTLIKPASPVAPSSSQQPSWGTNAGIVWPCSSQMAGIGTGAASGNLTDELIGTYTLSWQQAASPINVLAYDTAGNGSGTNGLVGLALNKPSDNSSTDGMTASNAALALSAVSGMAVIKFDGSGHSGGFYGFGSSAGGLSLRWNSISTKLEVHSLWTDSVVWTGATLIPQSEWHVIAWTIDATTPSATKVNVAIDGTSDSNSTDLTTTANASNFITANGHFWMTNNQFQDAFCDMAFIVLWTSPVALSDLGTRSTASSTASAGPYAMITASTADILMGAQCL